jgi:hypothetical protein
MLEDFDGLALVTVRRKNRKSQVARARLKRQQPEIDKETK